MRSRHRSRSRSKSRTRSLYDNPSSKKYKSKVNAGYGTAQRARETLKRLQGYPYDYQLRVVNTMINRAIYHANQTEDMRESIKVYKKWLNKK
jgi:hypothetical protein